MIIIMLMPTKMEMMMMIMILILEKIPNPSAGITFTAIVSFVLVELQ